MGAISALKTAFSVVAANPILVVAAFVSSVILGVLGLIPLLGALLNLVIAPFVVGGMFGMANNAIDGSTTLGDFVDSGTDNYVSILGAYLVLLGAAIAVSFVVVIVAAVLGTFTLGMAGSGAPGGAEFMAGSGVVVLLFVVLLALAAVVAGLAIQFYAVAIVVSGVGAIDSFKYSFALFRKNVASVVGFSLLQAFVSVCIFIVPLVATVFAIGFSPDSAGIPIMIGALLAGSVFFGVGTAVLQTYQTTYYRDRLDAGGAAARTSD